PRLERGHRVEGRREGERLALFDVHVADIGRVDRLDAALAQRIVDRARNQIVDDVVENLILVALLDDARRRLARAEPGNAGLARVVARNAIDFRGDDVVRDFDAQVLARVVDVEELGFHVNLWWGLRESNPHVLSDTRS